MEDDPDKSNVDKSASESSSRSSKSENDKKDKDSNQNSSNNKNTNDDEYSDTGSSSQELNDNDFAFPEEEESNEKELITIGPRGAIKSQSRENIQNENNKIHKNENEKNENENNENELKSLNSTIPLDFEEEDSDSSDSKDKTDDENKSDDEKNDDENVEDKLNDDFDQNESENEENKKSESKNSSNSSSSDSSDDENSKKDDLNNTEKLNITDDFEETDQKTNDVDETQESESKNIEETDQNESDKESQSSKSSKSESKNETFDNFLEEEEGKENVINEIENKDSNSDNNENDRKEKDEESASKNNENDNNDNEAKSEDVNEVAQPVSEGQFVSPTSFPTDEVKSRSSNENGRLDDIIANVALLTGNKIDDVSNDNESATTKMTNDSQTGSLPRPRISMNSFDNMSSSLMQTEEINFGFDQSASESPQKTISKAKIESQFSLTAPTEAAEQTVIIEQQEITDQNDDQNDHQKLKPIIPTPDEKPNLTKSAPIKHEPPIPQVNIPTDIGKSPINSSKSSTRSSFIIRPKTAMAPFQVPPFDPKLWEQASNRTSRMKPEVQQFRKMILGENSARKTTVTKKAKKPKYESLLTHDEIVELADDLVRGRKKRVDNPAIIADVIDELTNIRLETMQNGDYVETQKIIEIINSLRQSYRQQDRLSFHRERMDDLESRIDEAKATLLHTKEEWRQKEKEMALQCEYEAKEMDDRHADELEKLEEEWKDPKTTRKFNKRSPYLLQQLQIEKNMLLTGQYVNAQIIHRINQRYEKNEVNEKFVGMLSEFEIARQKMLDDQQAEVNELKDSQDFRWRKFKKFMNNDIEICQKRVNNIQFLIDEEGNYENFCALKFKKSSEFVLPMTCTLNGGSDIPTAGKIRMTMGSDGKMSKFREMNNFPPLQLPPLQARRLKSRPKAFKVKPAKAKQNDV
ncbi:hypothetical protein TRFO_37566 [Tritrichomonas foetus]|uniref:Uncharacterized protein n=1 Tax=Tritrichomonas foetus TaxID=1144522 RepID=A0A1J4JF41_9EUKA|nr:hypothetical protein TRFO_37566 [Tritrichomonas foetus]|eukprot:OHS96267.1 hypothetical protein TRFO_37566 [Tritrichomonas foetus]